MFAVVDVIPFVFPSASPTFSYIQKTKIENNYKIKKIRLIHGNLRCCWDIFQKEPKANKVEEEERKSVKLQRNARNVAKVLLGSRTTAHWARREWWYFELFDFFVIDCLQQREQQQQQCFQRAGPWQLDDRRRLGQLGF